MLTHHRLALRGLGPAVWRYLAATGLVGFAVDGGIYAVLLNLYLLRMGYGPEQIGLVNSAGTFTFALASLPAGALGGRWGSRRMMLAGLAMMLAGCALLPMADALAPTWRLPWLVGFVITIYVGLAIFFVNTAPFLMEAVAVERRTQVVGLQTALISLSAFGGSLFGGVLPPLFALLIGADTGQPAPYRYALAASALSLGAAMLLVGGIRSAPAAATQATSFPAAATAAPVSAAATYMPIFGLLAMIALVRTLQVAGVAAVTTYSNVYLDAALQVPTATIGAILAAGRLFGAAAALTTASLARRFGNWSVVLWASVASALSILPIALIPHWAAAATTLIAVISLSWIRYGASLVYFLELVPVERRSTASGVLEMAAGICFTAVSFGGGLVIARFGYTTLFLAAAAVTALSAVAFWVLFRGRAAPAELSAPSPEIS